jgi:carbamoyltransferase
MTQRIGLKPNEEEYILMGMAALGDPSRLTRDLLDDFVRFPNNESGNPVEFKQNLHRGCLSWRPDLKSIQDRFDIAAATQQIYELIFNRVLQHAVQLSSSRNLVLMGGCALNCVANGQAYQYFDNMWIMPSPGDSGSAIGAVLAHRKQHIKWPGPLLGYEVPSRTTNKEIVDYLLDNKMCGLARGPAEFGPRALGNRSLLADPRGTEIKEQVNAIKQRQQFRPFAPAILEELVHDYFDMPGHRDSSRYMQVVARCKRGSEFPAIIHIDGTSRVQTVPNDGSPFRLLLEEWYKATGCPMLLNTSLNIKGQPMVNNADDARAWEQAYGVKVFM